MHIFVGAAWVAVVLLLCAGYQVTAALVAVLSCVLVSPAVEVVSFD